MNGEKNEMDRIKVLKKNVGEPPEVIEIEHSLKSIQKHVGGHFEIIRLGADVCIVANEEGKMKCKPNFDLGNDVIMGDCFFVSEGVDHGETKFVDLTKQQVDLIKRAIDLYSPPKNQPNSSNKTQ